jgi:hypothetical protein
MPPCPLISKQSFSPETARSVTLAFERVCQELGLTVKDDPATRLVAEKIIAFAKSGTEDDEALCDLTLQQFCKRTT